MVRSLIPSIEVAPELRIRVPNLAVFLTPPPPDRTDEMLRSVAADAAHVRHAVDCFWSLPPSDPRRPQDECLDFEKLIERSETFPTPGDYYFPRRPRRDTRILPRIEDRRDPGLVPGYASVTTSRQPVSAWRRSKPDAD